MAPKLLWAQDIEAEGGLDLPRHFVTPTAADVAAFLQENPDIAWEAIGQVKVTGRWEAWDDDWVRADLRPEALIPAGEPHDDHVATVSYWEHEDRLEDPRKPWMWEVGYDLDCVSGWAETRELAMGAADEVLRDRRWALVRGGCSQGPAAPITTASDELLRLRAVAKAAEEAITHTLVRAREDAKGLGYYLGPRTESFEGLVRALALLLGKDAAEVRAAALGRSS